MVLKAEKRWQSRRKQRMMRNLSASLLSKSGNKHPGKYYTSLSGENEITINPRQKFEAKRNIDQHHEGGVLHKAAKDREHHPPPPPPPPLLPPPRIPRRSSSSSSLDSRLTGSDEDEIVSSCPLSVLSCLTVENGAVAPPTPPKNRALASPRGHRGKRAQRRMSPFKKMLVPFRRSFRSEKIPVIDSEVTKSVRFADTEGRPLSIVHYTETMYSLGSPEWRRMIVLLLSPMNKKFEFMHVSFNVYEKLPISDVLARIAEIATHESLRKQTYVGLCRASVGGRELINSLPIQKYQLERDEVLVGIWEGCSSKMVMKFAEPLLSNKKVLNVVRKSKLAGWSLHKPMRRAEDQSEEKKQESKKRVVPLQNNPPGIRVKEEERTQDAVVAYPPSSPLGKFLSIGRGNSFRRRSRGGDDDTRSRDDESHDSRDDISLGRLEAALHRNHEKAPSKDVGTKIGIARVVTVGVLTALAFSVQSRNRR